MTSHRPVRDSRYTALRQVMEEEGLDAIVVSQPDWIKFVANFNVDVLAWERPVLVVLPRSGEPFGLFNELSTHHLQYQRAIGELWIEDVRIYAEHPRMRDRVPLALDWPATVASLMREHGLARATIGADAVSARLRDVARCASRLDLVDVGARMRATRLIKTAQELADMRHAAELSDWVQGFYRSNIRSGRLVEELDHAAGGAVAVRAAETLAGRDVQSRLLTFAGEASIAPHGLGTRTGQAVDGRWPIVNIVIVRVDGMTVENERTWFCSSPSTAQARAFEVMCAAQRAAIAELRPGRPVCAFDAASFAVFAEAGLDIGVFHRAGHGVGLGHGGAVTAHDFPDATAWEQRALMQNEVFSAEPGVYLDGLGGFRHDDTVVVDDVPEVLTAFPRDLASLTVQ